MPQRRTQRRTKNTMTMDEKRNRIKCPFCGHSKQNHKLTFHDKSELDNGKIELLCLICDKLSKIDYPICLEGEVEDEA